MSASGSGLTAVSASGSCLTSGSTGGSSLTAGSTGGNGLTAGSAGGSGLTAGSAGGSGLTAGSAGGSGLTAGGTGGSGLTAGSTGGSGLTAGNDGISGLTASIVTGGFIAGNTGTCKERIAQSTIQKLCSFLYTNNGEILLRCIYAMRTFYSHNHITKILGIRNPSSAAVDDHVACVILSSCQITLIATLRRASS